MRLSVVYSFSRPLSLADKDYARGVFLGLAKKGLDVYRRELPNIKGFEHDKLERRIRNIEDARFEFDVPCHIMVDIEGDAADFQAPNGFGKTIDVFDRLKQAFEKAGWALKARTRDRNMTTTAVITNETLG